MKRAALILLGLTMMHGCAPAPKNVQAKRADLRTKDGVCAGAVLETSPHINAKACLRQGSPGTLHDDGHSLLLVDMRAGYLDGANPGNYQLTVWKDGEIIHQGMMKDRVPSPPYGKGMWFGSDVVMFSEFAEWPDGLYEIQWVADWNTEIRGKSTIAIGISLPENKQSRRQ